VKTNAAMGSNNSLAKIIFHLSLVNALTRGIKCIQRLGSGDPHRRNRFTCERGNRCWRPCGTTVRHTAALYKNANDIWLLPIHDDTRLLHARRADSRLASGRLSVQHGDFIWTAYHRAVRPATVDESCQTFQSTLVSLRRLTYNKCQNTNS